MKNKLSVLVIMMILCVGIETNAQFSGTSLMEYQYGQLPDANESSFNSLYNQIRLNYRHQNLVMRAGVQYYYSPYGDRNYAEPAWFGLNYRNKGWELKAGNFNETLGRGILLRSYEIKGAVLEDVSYRSKHYFYRDMLGASAGFKGKKYSVKALWGYALNNVFPPTEGWDQRRENQVGALAFDYKLFKQKVGGVVMRVENSGTENDFAMGTLSGRLLPFMNYYTAYAFNMDADVSGHAFYGSLNLAFDKLGASVEFKDYEKFVIGSGINEPPALVKEHSYRVLNRSTHVLQPQNEMGFQLEVFYQFNTDYLLTVNHTFARNEFGKTFDYNEWFAELSASFESSDLKLFVDWADDPFKEESKRFSTGVNLDQTVGTKNGLLLELEWQRFDRNEKGNQNAIAGATFRHGSKLFLGLLTEWSNDAFVTDSEKTWLSGTVRYKLNNKNTLQLFAGERRGGPACSAGVCYEVLDFKGLELRWNARF